MARVFLKRTVDGFVPADAAAEELCGKFKVGEQYRADIVKPRSLHHHRLFMALLQLTFQNQERYTDPRAFRREVARQAGHVEEHVTADGEVIEIPLSYDFDTVPDQVEFHQKFARAMSVCANMMHGLGVEELEAELSRYCDDMYGAGWQEAA